MNKTFVVAVVADEKIHIVFFKVPSSSLFDLSGQETFSDLSSDVCTSGFQNFNSTMFWLSLVQIVLMTGFCSQTNIPEEDTWLLEGKACEYFSESSFSGFCDAGSGIKGTSDRQLPGLSVQVARLAFIFHWSSLD